MIEPLTEALIQHLFQPVRPDIEPSEFRSALRELAGGISVITAGSPAERTGLTATSVTALSAEPPALLVCVNRSSSTFPVIERRGAFAVNILADHHRDVADRFAGKGGVAGSARYEGADWITLETGSAVLSDALVALDCDVEEIVVRHSHAIIIGRVRAVHKGGGSSGLVYWRGQYGNTTSATADPWA